MKKKQPQKKHSNKKGGMIFQIIFGISTAILIFTALIVLFSAITLLCDSPHKFIMPLSVFALITSSFFGGFIAIKKNKGREPLLCGVLCGVANAIIFSLIFLIIGMIFDTESTLTAWIFRGLTTLASPLGALVAAKAKKQPSRRKKFKR